LEGLLGANPVQTLLLVAVCLTVVSYTV